MRHELEEFGYLFIRGFHPDNLIKIARKGKNFNKCKIAQKISVKYQYFEKIIEKNLKNILDTL